MSGERNTEDAFALLLYRNTKFANILKRNNENMNILNVYFHVFYNAHCNIVTQCGKRFKTERTRDFVNCVIS